MRRTTRTARFWLVTGAALALPQLGRASGSGAIDTTDATLVPGAAPVPGEVVIEEGVDLGAPPSPYVAEGGFSSYWNHYGWITGNGVGTIQEAKVDAGLGGPDFRAQVDLQLPGGTYDFGEFVVDPGVTVTFTGATTLRIAKGARVEGLVEMTDASAGDRLAVRVAESLTIVGHAGEPCGFSAEGDGTDLFLDVEGDVAQSAEDGAEAVFAAGREIRISALPQGAGGFGARYERARFEAQVCHLATWGWQSFASCSATGRLGVETHARDEDGYSVRFAGGTFEGGLEVLADGSVLLDDGVAVTGGTCRMFAVAFSGTNPDYGFRIASGCSIEVEHGVTIETDGTLEIGDGVSIRTTAGADGDWFVLGAREELLVGEGAYLLHAGGEGLDRDRPSMNLAGSPLRVRGTVRGRGEFVVLHSTTDVVLEDHAVVDATSGHLILGAEGAVVAEDGEVLVAARDVDVRCVSGDLDLDLRALDASGGKFAAISNGRVRLRGTYTAARDIQVLSLMDVVSVAGARLATDDVQSGLSGFVRLATYGSPTTVIIGGDLPADGEDEEEDESDDDGDDAGKMPGRAATADGGTILINAAEATITTGESGAQSGSILLQNQEGEGGSSAKATIRVSRAAARTRDGEVVTQVRGTIQLPRRRVDLTGSGRVVAGTVDERMILGGNRGAPRGEGGAARLRFARATSSRPAFTIEVREPAASSGETTRVGFHRAGLHVRGSFRRPRVR